MYHLYNNKFLVFTLMALTLTTILYLIILVVGILFTFNTVSARYIEQEPVDVQPRLIHIEPKQLPPVKPKPVKVVKKVNKDTYILAQIINAEAKGEPYTGMLAVGNVVLNRVEHPDFPDTIKEVIFQKGQFSPVSNGSIYDKPSDDALKAATELLNGKRVVSSEVVFFYNPDISTSRWIFTREVVTEIGNHAFAI